MTPNMTWMKDGACVDSTPAQQQDFFAFPKAEPRRVAAAKMICAGCPVRSECLDYALEHEHYNVWGGMNEDERRSLLRRRKRHSRTQGRVPA